MATILKSLVSMFGRDKNTGDSELLSWAKNEYGNDWQFAYNELRRGNKSPVIGVKN